MSIFNFVGVDIAKDKFDVAFRKGEHYKHRQFINDISGFEALTDWLKTCALLPWVCMEATGHYGEELAEYLYDQKIRVSVVNPRQIKDFSKAKMTRNKNDYVDAKVIAAYGELMQPRNFEPSSESEKELKALMNLLDTLKKQMIQLKNQLDSVRGKLAKEALQKIINDLAIKIAEIEKTIKDLIGKNPEMNAQAELLKTIKGIGTLTASKVVACGGIKSYQKAKQFAASIGITPMHHQSGKRAGKTTISRQGDASLRKTLYMAALVGMRHNPILKAFAERLKQVGKAPKSIICAVMRKLAHIIFGVLKNAQPFDPAYCKINA